MAGPDAGGAPAPRTVAGAAVGDGGPPPSVARRETEGKSAQPPRDDRIRSLFGRQDGSGVGSHEGTGKSAAPLNSFGSGGSPQGAVQRAPAMPGTVKDPVVAPPKAGIDKVGFVDHSDGANIRTGPAEAGGETVRATPLPPATRVFVSGTHPEAPQWWYVTAQLEGTLVRGYVQGFRVNTDLPEPLAELHDVKGGETAEQYAKQKFGAAVSDGQDLRYYENVLLYVNQQRGRGGINGTYQDPRVFGGSNNVQLTAGHRIWLVSAPYAKALQSVVPSGSLTGGAVAKVKRFVGHIEDILRSVTESRHHFGEVAGEYAQAIRDHLPEIAGIVAAFIMAEATSAFLAATPTGVGQLAAIVIQLALAAFGAAGLVMASVEAVKHASQWLTLAWTANGKDESIAAASKEFLKMLVSVAMAALSYAGVKGNYGNALKIGNSMPTGGLPALAIAGGGQLGGGAGAGAGVLVGPGTGALGVGGNAMMQSDKDGGGSGASEGQSASAKASREARVKELAKDPAQGGAATAKTVREAEVGVSLEEAGKLPKPITRDPTGGAEFIDAAKQAWDVKRFNSSFPPNTGGYSLEDSLRKIGRELSNGENVILDTIDLRPEHVAELRAGVTARGWDARVIWHP